MQSSHILDRLSVAFSDGHAVAGSGLVLPATLAEKLGLKELFDREVDLGTAPGRANVGAKALTLIYSALAGGDSIDDADMLRAGETPAVLGHKVRAPSTLGTFLRSFTWGRALQLDAVSRQALERAWQAGAGPANAPLTIDLDSTICETYRLIVRREPPSPQSRLALFTCFSYHAFLTDREGDTLLLEADHRRHAEIENVIRDLKYGLGLNHLPSGRFAANAAWFALQVMAHNLGCWLCRLGLDGSQYRMRTLRKRFLYLPGRLTRSARRLFLSLPARWPRQEEFSGALVALRSLPPPLPA